MTAGARPAHPDLERLLDGELVRPAALAVRAQPQYRTTGDPVRVSAEVLRGLHAAGLFAADGTLLVVRADVDRRSAVDKVPARALPQGRAPALAPSSSCPGIAASPTCSTSHPQRRRSHLLPNTP
jgi:hypothetical protein